MPSPALLVGFVGAFRRSELVALNVEGLEESELGFKVTIRPRKHEEVKLRRSPQQKRES